MKMFSLSKSISWKTSLIIAVSLHVGGYLAIKQYSSYRTRIAKELRESREALYADKSHSEWPSLSHKNKVVTKPKVVVTLAKPTIKKTSFEINIPIPKITFTSPKQPKTAVVKQEIQKPVKTVKTSQIIAELKPKPEISKPFSNPADIPIRRAVMVTKNDGKMREITEETRTIIDSRVAL